MKKIKQNIKIASQPEPDSTDNPELALQHAVILKNCLILPNDQHNYTAVNAEIFSLRYIKQ